jgi:hypothetical protein
LIKGLYSILENSTLPGQGISADVIWGKKMKRGREKAGKCKRERKKRERKRKKGKEKGRKKQRKWE